MPKDVYKRYIDPALTAIGHSEELHTATRELLHHAETPLFLQILKRCITQGQPISDERLQVPIGNGVVLKNPVGVGAGWDKYGDAEAALFHILNFSTIEVGTVTPRPQLGNPKPRQHMIAPGVCVQRLGFPGPGMENVRNNLERYRNSGIPIGISLGKNKTTPLEDAPQDYAAVTDTLYEHASYFVINVSSPNTPGLRRLQGKDKLVDIIQAVLETMDNHGKRKPLYIKVAPELSLQELDDVIDLVETHTLTGIIASNTTTDQDILKKYSEGLMGGLSGDDADYRSKVRKQIVHAHTQTKGEIQIVGIGGVKNATTALDYIMHGASWVQVVTAIRGEGPMVGWKINTGILNFMEEHGIQSIQELVGAET